MVGRIVSVYSGLGEIYYFLDWFLIGKCLFVYWYDLDGWFVVCFLEGSFSFVFVDVIVFMMELGVGVVCVEGMKVWVGIWLEFLLCLLC